LSSICSYISNIDASYALFFRSTPRMTFSDLVMELASPESCFQAQSKEECFIEVKTWRSRSGLGDNNLTIRTAVEILSDRIPMAASSYRQAFSHLSLLNMFTLVHALYLQVHHLQTSGIQSVITTKTNPVTNALRNWKDLWSSPSRDAELIDVMDKESQNGTAWQSIGFIKHAPEYWLLMYLSLQRSSHRSLSTANSTLDTITRGEDIDMDGAKSLIAELKTADFHTEIA
jgi:hypothetical protein